MVQSSHCSGCTCQKRRAPGATMETFSWAGLSAMPRSRSAGASTTPAPSRRATSLKEPPESSGKTRCGTTSTPSGSGSIPESVYVWRMSGASTGDRTPRAALPTSSHPIAFFSLAPLTHDALLRHGGDPFVRIVAEAGLLLRPRRVRLRRHLERVLRLPPQRVQARDVRDDVACIAKAEAPRQLG